MRTASSLFLLAAASFFVACSSNERQFASTTDDASVDDTSVDDTSVGADSAPADGAAEADGTTESDGGTDAATDAPVPFDCTGKADGTSCGEGSICLAGACKGSSCGDGYVDTAGGEDCEDGNDVGGDGCTSCKFDCTGDADCDDKNPCTKSTCDKTATKAVCSSELVTDGTTCTVDGVAGQCKGGTCTKPGCGNGILDSGEECDDGNKDDTDGCRADCKYTCKANADCDDGDKCTGTETCDTATHKCKAGTAVTCSPKAGCTGTCDPASGKCGYPDLDKDGTGCDLDCNDADPAVFPGAFECKDGKDNDCNASTSDTTAPSCTCYQDGDKDGYAVLGASSLSAVTCPDGYTRREPVSGDKKTYDCHGANASVSPAQTSYFTKSYCTGAVIIDLKTGATMCSTKSYSYDYNCDGTISQQYTSLASSSGCQLITIFGHTSCIGSGWTTSSAPACGVAASYKTCKAVLGKGGTYYCSSSTSTITQACK